MGFLKFIKGIGSSSNRNKQTISNIPVNQLITITELPGKKSNHFFVYLLIGLCSAAICFLWKRVKMA